MKIVDTSQPLIKSHPQIYIYPLHQPLRGSWVLDTPENRESAKAPGRGICLNQAEYDSVTKFLPKRR